MLLPLLSLVVGEDGYCIVDSKMKIYDSISQVLLICTRLTVFQSAEWPFVRHRVRFCRLSWPCQVSRVMPLGERSTTCVDHT